MRFFIKITLAVSLFSSLLLLGCSCSKVEEIAKKTKKALDEMTPKPRFVVVLLDETGSFKLSSNSEDHFWQEALSWVVRIVESLQPGDKFCVIGIDFHGGDQDDIKIGVEPFFNRILTSLEQKEREEEINEERERIKEEVMNLKCRRTGKSDIFGALRHAAKYLNSEEEEYQNVVFVFSDMHQTASVKDINLEFPKNTEIYCLYVNYAEKINDVSPKWPVRMWKDILKSAENAYFYEYGQTKDGLNKYFQTINEEI